MSIKLINPSTVNAPIGPYSQGALVQKAGEWLHIAGQIGAPSNGIVASSFEEQAALAWQNVCAVLYAADMDSSHLVKVVTYIVGTDNIPLLAPIRLQYLAGARPAATLLVVDALARPDWQIEIEAIAFKE